MQVTPSESAGSATLETVSANFEFDELYIFGDSLSDPGNLFDFSGGIIPPPPYFQGRFSNGLVWSDYLAEDLDLSPVRISEVQANPLAATEGINFAFAGANSDNSNSNNSNSLAPANAPLLPGLTAQIEGYQTFIDAIGPSARDNPLHILWIGANDYLGGGQTDPQVTLTNIGDALQDLYDGGARNFLVPNLPDLGNTPVGQSRAPELLNTLTMAHNQGLSAILAQFEQDNPDAGIIPFDVNAIFAAVEQNPSDFGFTTTGGCFTLADLLGGSLDVDAVQACGETSLFWDDLHPTTQAHQILADAALVTLEDSLSPSAGPIAFEGFPFRSNFLELSSEDNLNLHYLDEGGGDPVILLHGVPTSSFLWRDIIPELSQNNRVIVPDFLNFGLSDKTEDPLSFVEHGEHLEELIEHLNLQNVTLIGHDWGGPIALTYAEDNPDNVNALAFLESPILPVPNTSALQFLPGNFFENFVDPANSQTNIIDNNLFVEGYLFEPTFAGISESLTEAEQNVYRTPFTNPGDREQLLDFPLQLPIQDTTGHPVFDPDGPGGNPPAPVPNIQEFADFATYLATTDTPLLYILGNPGFIPSELILPLAAQIPGLELQTVGNADDPARHFIPEDVPEELSEVLSDWIADNPVPSTPDPVSGSGIQLQITVENLAPPQGIDLAPVWFSFHDGSFDFFDVGEASSEAFEFLVEDGLTGLEERLVPGTLEAAIAAGLDTQKLPLAVQQAIALELDLSQLPAPPGTLAGDFETSSASANGGTQGMVTTTTFRSDPDFFALIGDSNVAPEPGQLTDEQLADVLEAPFFLVQAPGETETFTIELNGTAERNRYFSYASMLFPTNDAFIGNDDPEAIEIFNEQGEFIGADFLVLGSEVLDGGTEVNDESPETLFYTLDTFGDSVDENGVIQPFSGFLPAGQGGLLDFEFNGEKIAANADFTQSGGAIARITVTLVDTTNTPVDPPVEVPTVTGTDGNDQLPVNGGRALGLAGDDQIFNNGGDSEQFGGEGNDGLFGSSGNDLLDGGPGDDKLYGNSGRDIFLGGAGDDEMYGGEDSEVAFAGDGNDLIYGNESRDLLVGGAGDDTLYGGGGSDLFVYALGDGGDVIEDFQVGEDGIGLIQGELTFADISLEQDGQHTVLGVDSTGETLAVLKFTQASDLGESSFTLVPGTLMPEQALALL